MQRIFTIQTHHSPCAHRYLPAFLRQQKKQTTFALEEGAREWLGFAVPVKPRRPYIHRGRKEARVLLSGRPSRSSSKNISCIQFISRCVGPRNSFDISFFVHASARTVCHTLTHAPKHTHATEVSQAAASSSSVEKSTQKHTERKRYYQKLHSVCLVNTWLLLWEFQEMRSRKNISKFSEARDRPWIPAMDGCIQSKQNVLLLALLLLVR